MRRPGDAGLTAIRLAAGGTVPCSPDVTALIISHEWPRISDLDVSSHLEPANYCRDPSCGQPFAVAWRFWPFGAWALEFAAGVAVWLGSVVWRQMWVWTR